MSVWGGLGGGGGPQTPSSPPISSVGLWGGGGALWGGGSGTEPGPSEASEGEERLLDVLRPGGGGQNEGDSMRGAIIWGGGDKTQTPS